MPATAPLCFVDEQPAPKVRVIRFTRPDLRPQLDPNLGDDNVLYRDIMASLGEIEHGETIIFNFGLVERFPTAFFQLMMRLRQFVLEKHGQIFLSCFRPEFLQTVKLMGGDRLFRLVNSEEAALNEAKGK